MGVYTVQSVFGVVAECLRMLPSCVPSKKCSSVWAPRANQQTLKSVKYLHFTLHFFLFFPFSLQVMDTLSKLSHTAIAQQTGLRYVEMTHYILFILIIQLNTMWQDTAVCDIRWYNMIWYYTTWYGMAWCMKLLNLTQDSFFFLKRPFPTEESVEDEDIYNHLEDLIEYVILPLLSFPFLI